YLSKLRDDDCAELRSSEERSICTSGRASGEQEAGRSRPTDRRPFPPQPEPPPRMTSESVARGCCPTFESSSAWRPPRRIYNEYPGEPPGSPLPSGGRPTASGEDPPGGEPHALTRAAAACASRWPAGRRGRAAAPWSPRMAAR